MNNSRYNHPGIGWMPIRLFSQVEEKDSLQQYVGQGASNEYIDSILSDVNRYRAGVGVTEVTRTQLASKLFKMAKPTPVAR